MRVSCGRACWTSCATASCPIRAWPTRASASPSAWEFTRERDAEIREHRQRFGKLVARIDKLVDFIADGGASAAVAEKLRRLEREADAERNRVAVLEKLMASVVKLPSPDDLMGIVFDLRQRLLGDITRGREELRRIFRDGRITLVPQPGGFYGARSEILPLVLLTQSPSGERADVPDTNVADARAELS